MLVVHRNTDDLVDDFIASGRQKPSFEFLNPPSVALWTTNLSGTFLGLDQSFGRAPSFGDGLIYDKIRSLHYIVSLRFTTVGCKDKYRLRGIKLFLEQTKNKNYDSKYS